MVGNLNARSRQVSALGREQGCIRPMCFFVEGRPAVGWRLERDRNFGSIVRRFSTDLCWGRTDE